MSKPLAISYIRFSSKEQAKGDSYRRQYEATVKYCDDNDLQLAEDVIYDEGVSAFTGDNKKAALGQLAENAENGFYPKGTHLIVESFDRLGREQPIKQLNFVQSLLDAGLKIVILQTGKIYEEATLANAMDLMFALMSMIRSNEESELKSKRICASWDRRRELAKEGVVFQARVPSWLKVVDGKIEEIPKHVKLLKDIFVMATEKDMGIGSITNHLNKNKIPFWGNLKRHRSAEHVWIYNYIATLLKNRAVLGEYQPKKNRKPVGDPIKNYYPVVIEEDLFNLAQHKRRKRRVRGGGRALPKQKNLVRSISYCAKCGASTHFHDKGLSTNGNCNIYLVCSVRCGARAVTYSKVENIIVSTLPTADWAKVLHGE